MKTPSIIVSQSLFKNGCWGCKRAQEDTTETFICPQLEQHQQEYEQQHE